MITVFTALASTALAAMSPAATAQPLRAAASITVTARIVPAVELRNGVVVERHQRRRITAPEGTPLTVLEFE